MKHLIILLLMLATFQSYATDKAADDDARDNGNDSSQTEDSAPQSDNGKKPPKGEGEEEPDCE
jgi:hypothetical protein